MDLSQYLLPHASQIPAFLDFRGTAAERLALAARCVVLEFLLQHGGAFPQAVVIGEGIQTLRLWEIPASPPFRLGAASSRLLEALQAVLQGKKEVKLPTPSISQGEAFFFHAIYLRTHGSLKHPVFQSEILRVSPFTRLLLTPRLPSFPNRSLRRGEVGRVALQAPEMEALLRHPWMPFFTSVLADQWADLPLPSEDESHVQERIDDLHCRCATLQLFLQTVEATQRTSLYAALVFFFQRLLRDPKAQTLQQIRHFRWSLSSRERYLGAYGSLYRLGQDLEDSIQREVIEPGAFGWKDPLETRIFTSRVSRLWSSGGLRDRVAEAERHLR